MKVYVPRLLSHTSLEGCELIVAPEDRNGRVKALADCDAAFFPENCTSEELMEKALANHLGKKIIHEQTPLEQRIFGAIFICHGVTIEDLCSRLRTPKLVYCRMIFAHLMGRTAKTRIGALIGRDHSTVCSYAEKFRDYYDYIDEFRSLADPVMKMVK
jgi:ATPase involved in DNA replication initiation